MIVLKNLITGIVTLSSQSAGTLYVTVGQLMSHLASEGVQLVGDVSCRQIYSCLIHSMTTVMPTPWDPTLLRGILQTGNPIVWASDSPLHMLKPMLDGMPAHLSQELTSSLTEVVTRSV